MPESRTCNTTETPYRLDELPPPNLTAVDNLVSSGKPIQTKINVRETTATREIATQTYEAHQPGTVADYSINVENSSKVDTSKTVEETSPKLKIGLTTNPSTMETNKAKTEAPMAWFKPRYPVAVSENEDKPIVVTSKRPFDSFCSDSLFQHRLATNVTSGAETRPPEVPATSVSSNTTQTLTAVTSSAEATSNSPTLTRNTTSLPPRSQNSSASTLSSSTNWSTSSTGASTSSGISSNSTSESTGLSMRGNKNSSGKKTPRKGGRRVKHELQLSEDVDNYMGNKPIDELLRFIES